MTRSKRASPKAGVRRAIVICNGTFDDSDYPHLPGVTRDHAALTRVLGGPAAAFEVTALLDEGLLAARKAVAKVCSEATADDTLLFYYSGASYVGGDRALYLPTKDSSKEYPFATALDPEFILRELRESPCRRFVVLIDGCHAGAFFAHNRGIPNGLFAITACSADELTADTPEGGAFTCALVQALEDANTDRDGDGQITIDDVHEVVKAKLSAGGHANVPQKWVWNVREPIYLSSAPPRVFFSYCGDDVELATQIKEGLEHRGFSIWFDREGIKSGNWKTHVTAALRQARAVVVLLTPAAFASDAVRKELDFANDEDLPLVPVTKSEIKQAALPEWYRYDFGSIHRIAIDEAAPEGGLDLLARAIRSAKRRLSTSPAAI